MSATWAQLGGLLPPLPFSANHCRSCGRPLSNPHSRAIDIGPICARRGHDQESTMQEDAGDVAALPFDPVTRTVECRRGADGILRCNIPQRHKHHSPTGFECGFAGSGPADLALNILALFIPAPPDPRPRLDQEQPRAQDWEDWDEAEDPEYDRVKLHDGS